MRLEKLLSIIIIKIFGKLKELFHMEFMDGSSIIS